LAYRQSRPGHETHNYVSALMAEEGLSVQDAMDRAGQFHDELVDSFLAEVNNVPYFIEESELINDEVRQYIHALGNWVRACDQWSFESERYFGKDGVKVFNERTIVLRPKVEASSLPAHDLATAVDVGEGAEAKRHYAHISQGLSFALSLVLCLVVIYHLFMGSRGARVWQGE
jgi:hypothetical protein